MLTRITKYSVKNILRNKFLSISSVLVLTLLMFFINILLVLHDVSFKLIDSINSKLTISLYLNEWYSKTSLEVSDLIGDLNKLWKWVNIDYKTKEDILEDIKIKEPDLARILERTNPLPDTITLSNISLWEYEKVNSIIESKLFILVNAASDWWDEQHFSDYTSQYNKITSIINILNILQLWLYVIISIFIVSISIIIYSIIWNFIYYYKDEILVTRLVWWSKNFIYWPFIIQGGIYSFLAFITSFVIFVFILDNLNNYFIDFYSFTLSYNVFLLEMFIFVFIGWFAGYLSSKKYLK